MIFVDKIRSHALVKNTRGLSTVEYVIILCLLAILAIGTWDKFGGAIREKLDNATDEIEQLGSEG